MIKKLVIYLLIAIFVIGSVYFAFKGILRKERDRSLQNIEALQDTVRSYKTKIKELEVTVFETKRVVLSQADAIKVGLVERDALRKLNIKTLTELTALKIRLSIVIDSVPNTGEIVYIDNSKPALLLPFTFRDSTKYYSLSGGFDLLGKMDYSLTIASLNLDIYGGVDKKGVAKVSVTTDNPYIRINTIESVKITTPSTKRIGVGALLGYGITYKDKQFILAPSLTVGLFYRLW